MSRRYKNQFFGSRKRKANQINTIKRLSDRKNVLCEGVEHLSESTNNQVQPETEEQSSEMHDSKEFHFDYDDNVGAYQEIEVDDWDNENFSVDFNNIHSYSCMTGIFDGENEYQNDTSDGEFYLDDIDNWSDSSDESVWSVCSFDEDSDNESACFFLYGDEDDNDIDNESDENSLSDFNQESGEITGNRIVDLGHIFCEIRKINLHSKTCNFNDMCFAKPEVKKGFVSHFRLVCKKCRYIHTIKTSERRDDQFDLNYECVLGSMLIGIGFSQLEELTSILHIPCITSNSYHAKAEKVYDDLINAAEDSTKLVAQAEIEYVTKNGCVDIAGNPLVTGVVDAAWSKRSYRTNYSALSGSAVIIGRSTGKVLWQGVANKFCSVCKYISTTNKEYYDHICNINYVGPSTGMEPKLIVDGMKECDQKFNIRIHRIVGDGDSSVISEVLKANIYKNPSLKTVKIECSNHVERNVRGHLRKLGEKGPLKQYVTQGKIEEIIKAIRCARKHWNEQDTSIETKIENLRKDIYNAPFHVFGSHDNCADYFCTKKNSSDRNLVAVMKADSTFNTILDAMSRVRSNARSYLLNENTNIAEQFNGLIAKFTGGKRVNFSKSRSFLGRSKLAVLQHNTGRAYSTLCEYLSKTPSSVATKIEFKRIVKKLWSNNRKRPYQPKISGGGGVADMHYGNTSCSRPDMDAETYSFEREKFFDKLNTTQLKRMDIERDTVNQHKSSEWKQYRSDLLTASNFGRICSCRSPQSYDGIVKSMLYTDISHLKQIDHGKFYEEHAIRKLEEQYNIKVEKCGLFIDGEMCYLGASPDGIVGDKAIVEVKCPYSIFEKDIDESILNGKLNVWSRSRKPRKSDVNYIPTIVGINKRHKWFFQVQGQLHITQREFCYFVVWVGNDLPIKVEKIYRDDNFWKTKMEVPLKNFYEKALLPEIVDPRMSRSMPLRKFDKARNIIP